MGDDDQVDTSRRYLVTPEKPAKLPQYIAALASTLGAFSAGCALGYSSPAGSELLSNSTLHEKVHFDTDTESAWFSSTFNLGALVGSPLGGVCIKLIGRRGTTFPAAIVFLIGWAIIGAGQNFIMLVMGRVVTGISSGMISVAVPTYIAEFSSADLRGTLGSSFQLMITVGILYDYVLGTILSWRWLALVSAISPVLMFIAMLLSYESPSYLLSKGKVEEARKALQHFRGKNGSIEEEMIALGTTLEEAEKNKASLATLWIPYIRRPLFLALILFVFQQFSGLTAVVFNLDTIFDDAGAEKLVDWSGIIVGFVQVIATCVAVVLMDRAGRRLLLMISSLLMGISIAVIGMFFYLYEHKPEVTEHISWLPLASLIVFIGASAIGMAPVPWVMIGELFPPNVREIAGSLGTLTNWGFAFITSFIFLPLQDVMYDYGVYWLFASLCFVSFFFDLFFLKETKGKTLQEISEMFGAPSIDNEESVDEYDGSSNHHHTTYKTI